MTTIAGHSLAIHEKRTYPPSSNVPSMNYNNHDCRMRTTASKIVRLFQRKPARKVSRRAKSENQAVAALQAVTNIGASMMMGK